MNLATYRGSKALQAPEIVGYIRMDHVTPFVDVCCGTGAGNPSYVSEAVALGPRAVPLARKRKRSGVSRESRAGVGEWLTAFGGAVFARRYEEALPERHLW